MVIKAKRKKLSDSEVKKAIGSFKRDLKKTGVSFEHVYIFGSYAKGNPRVDSDIDVAVVLPDKEKQTWKKKFANIVWLAKQINVKLEPHLLCESDFANRWLSLPAEIKKHGVKV